MKDTRPINLDLSTIRFPINAIASILHRISGIILFVAVPMLLYLLQFSLASKAHFFYIQHFVTTAPMKLMLWLFLTVLIYHLFAGIRHIIMDIGFGESIEVARRSAKLNFMLVLIAIILAGIWIW